MKTCDLPDAKNSTSLSWSAKKKCALVQLEREKVHFNWFCIEILDFQFFFSLLNGPNALELTKVLIWILIWNSIERRTASGIGRQYGRVPGRRFTLQSAKKSATKPH